jgi:hypothetical protein
VERGLFWRKGWLRFKEDYKESIRGIGTVGVNFFANINLDSRERQVFLMTSSIKGLQKIIPLTLFLMENGTSLGKLKCFGKMKVHLNLEGIFEKNG